LRVTTGDLGTFRKIDLGENRKIGEGSLGEDKKPQIKGKHFWEKRGQKERRVEGRDF
jgi:hypothetical protein